MDAWKFAQEELTLKTVCGDTPGWYCSYFYERFGRFGPLIAGTLRVIVIIVLAAIFVRILRRVIKRFTRRIADQGVARFSQLSDRAPLASTGPIDVTRLQMRTETVGAVLNSVMVFLVWAIVAVTILGTAGVQLGPLIAGAGIAGVALGFGAQNLVKDFLAGIFILTEDQYGIGDIVNLRESIGAIGVSGTVEGISLRTTRLRDVEGTVWHVPNGDIRTAGNKSQQWARSLLDIGVDYRTDVAHATEVLKRVADEVWRDEAFGPSVIDEPEIWGVERFDPYQVTIRMVLKVLPAKQFEVNRELRARIKTAFEAEGISMPLPQQTVWLQSSEGDARPTRPPVPPA